MKKVFFSLIPVLMLLFIPPQLEAKNYKFNIDDTAETMLVRKHKDHKNYKIVKVISVDKNFDKAMDRGAMCTVADAMFRGIQGSVDPNTQETVPKLNPMLKSGLQAYYENKTFFDNFFKKGDFNQFIRRALTDLPSGTNNVKTKEGTRIVDIYILNTTALAEYLKQQGLDVQFANKLTL
ncbi:MAG: hypothetical protein K2G69_01175 [Muribaculaceae bacterium]|nr:hypothetical protein [Muribaculaceae bacterium]